MRSSLRRRDPVNIEHQPFDSRLLADLKAGADVDELVTRVVDHYRMTARQARDFLSFMTYAPATRNEEPEARRAYTRR
jgi:hypothetical protein